MTHLADLDREARGDRAALLGSRRQNVMSLAIVAPSVALNLYWVVHDGSGQAIYNILWIFIAVMAIRVAIVFVLSRGAPVEDWAAATAPHGAGSPPSPDPQGSVRAEGGAVGQRGA